MTLPVYFAGVRTYFALTTTLAALLIVLLLRLDGGGAAEVRVLLELLTPLPLLVVSAGLLQRDAALSLVAACQVRLGRLLIARWALAIAGALIVPLAVHVALAFAHADANLNALTWLAPTAFLGALGTAAAAVSASSGAGMGVALVYWAASLLTTPMLQDACAVTLPAVCTAAVWSSAYGLLAPAGPGWDMNRLALLVAAVALLSVTCHVYRHPERQLRAAASPEATS